MKTLEPIREQGLLLGGNGCPVLDPEARIIKATEPPIEIKGIILEQDRSGEIITRLMEISLL